MLLTQTAQYALRAMAMLATLPAAASARAKDISVHTHVPPHYLAKILRRLVEAGLLESEKGHHGGFKLAVEAQRIKVSEILRAIDEGLELKECAFGFPRCNPKSPCPLHPIYSQLAESVREWAERSTLADALTVPLQKV